MEHYEISKSLKALTVLKFVTKNRSKYMIYQTFSILSTRI